MPGGYPSSQGFCNVSSSLSGPSSKGTSVTASAKTYSGSFTTLIASTPSDACWMEVTIWPTTNTSNRTFTQIAAGAAASEVVFINDLMATSTTAGSSSTTYSFPVSIPAGTRLSARCNNTTADANNIQIKLYDGAFIALEGNAGVDSMGFVSGNPSGTDIDPGATPNTYGTWVQLTASTPRDYAGIMVCYGQNSTDNASATFPVFVEVGIGAGPTLILPDLTNGMNGAGLSNAFCPMIPFQIPAGTSVSVRAANGNATAGTRVIGSCLYGVYQ
jgi:hypothetical protein